MNIPGDRSIDLRRVLIDPASLFRSPEDVVRNARLSIRKKIEILCSWAYDAAELAVADEEGMVRVCLRRWISRSDGNAAWHQNRKSSTAAESESSRKHRGCRVNQLGREEAARQTIEVEITAALSEVIGHPGERCSGTQTHEPREATFNARVRLRKHV